VQGLTSDWKQNTPYLLDAVYDSGTNKWTFDASGVAWVAQNSPGFEYQIWTQVQDQAGNYETALRRTLSGTRPSSQCMVFIPVKRLLAVNSTITLSGQAVSIRPLAQEGRTSR